MLRNLNVKKAEGPDYLSCRLLKELAEELGCGVGCVTLL